MSLRDRLPDTGQRDAPLGWRLKSWVERAVLHLKTVASV